MAKRIYVCKKADGKIEFILAEDEAAALKTSKGEKILGDHSIQQWSEGEKSYQDYYKKFFK